MVLNALSSSAEDVNNSSYPGPDEYAGYGRVDMRRVMAHVGDGLVNVDDSSAIVYPNPFDPNYQKVLVVLPKNTASKARRLRIFSLNGQKVREVAADGVMAVWDGRNEDGELCAPGLYFYYLDKTSGSEKGKITLIR